MWADWRHTMEETHEHQGCYLAETSMSLYWLVGGCIHSTIIKGDDPVYQIFFINSKQSGEPTPCQAKVQLCTTSLSNPLIPNLLVSTGFQQKLDGDGVKGVYNFVPFFGGQTLISTTQCMCLDVVTFMVLCLCKDIKWANRMPIGSNEAASRTSTNLCWRKISVSVRRIT